MPAVTVSAVQRELVSHIPASIRTTCGPPIAAEPGSVAAVNCTYRKIVGLQYNLFASTQELRTDYTEVHRRYGFTGPAQGASCGGGKYEGQYRVGGRAVGHVLCFVDRSAHVAAIVWTDDRLDILSLAWRNDENLLALFDAWRTGVGPNA
jgi:hypothetical protein